MLYIPHYKDSAGSGGVGINSVAADDGSRAAVTSLDDWCFEDEAEEEWFLFLSRGERSRFFLALRSARSRSSCFWRDTSVFVCSRSCLTSSSLIGQGWTLETASELELEIGAVRAGAVGAL